MPGIIHGAKTDVIAPSYMGTAKRFGARWMKNESPTTLTRLYDSVGKTFQASIAGSAGSSGFDNEPIFKNIRLCNLVDGKVTAYQGDPGFTRTPTVGDVMVEIPKYYYQIVDTDTYRDFVISDKALPGFSISPRHAPHSGNQYGCEKYYASAYMLSEGWRSVSGKDMRAATTINEARSSCRARGPGYHLEDFAHFWTVALLYIVEVANWNSQQAIGFGIDNRNAMTGGSNTIVYHSGCIDNTRSATGFIKYRNLENLWGYECQHWCDGIVSQGFRDSRWDTYVAHDPRVYNNADINEFYKIWPLSSDHSSEIISTSFAVSLGMSGEMPWAQIPSHWRGYDTGFAGGSATYIPDLVSYAYVDSVGTSTDHRYDSFITAHGNGAGDSMGLFSFNYILIDAQTCRARLMYLP